MAKAYTEDLKKKQTLKTRDILKELPSFVSTFMQGITNTTMPRTRLAYAYDLRLFFNFLITDTMEFGGINIKDFTIENLNCVTTVHVEEFMEYLTYYIRNVSIDTKHEKDNISIETTNEEYGKSRKLAAIRSMFAYFYKREKLDKNIAELVDFPTKHNKPITILEPNEVALFLDSVEYGNKLTKKQSHYHAYTKTRDLAITTLLLGTGIRISECVGIDLDNIDFDVNGILIVRKGGDEAIIYFGDEVENALKNYIEEREKILALEGHEKALFLSMQKKRITDRAVQLLVKKYSKTVTNVKKITPHKLRSTYGTNLYSETGDIFLVGDVLGHSDVNTTKKHYIAVDNEKARKTANAVKLRD